MTTALDLATNTRTRFSRPEASILLDAGFTLKYQHEENRRRGELRTYVRKTISGYTEFIGDITRKREDIPNGMIWMIHYDRLTLEGALDVLFKEGCVVGYVFGKEDPPFPDLRYIYRVGGRLFESTCMPPANLSINTPNQSAQAFRCRPEYTSPNPFIHL